MTKDEALKLALEALRYNGAGNMRYGMEAILAIDTALAQPEQEPVSTKVSQCLAVLRPAVKGKFPQEQALEELAGYTSPPRNATPKREWVGLTHDEFKQINRSSLSVPIEDVLLYFAGAIEAKLKEKNT